MGKFNGNVEFRTRSKDFDSFRIIFITIQVKFVTLKTYLKNPFYYLI